MKKITKQVQQTYYVCEGCGTESLLYSSDCLECKQRQVATCSHKWLYEYQNRYDEAAVINRDCSKCGKTEERGLNHLTPAQAKIVWEMLEGEK